MHTPPSWQENVTYWRLNCILQYGFSAVEALFMYDRRLKHLLAHSMYLDEVEPQSIMQRHCSQQRQECDSV